MSVMYDLIASKVIKPKAGAPGITLSQITEANEALDKRYESLTAVFTGATHGVGLGTLKAFVRRIPKPRAIIIGRNRDRFEDEMASLRAINPNAALTFIEGELSTIKGVDAICDKVEEHLANSKADLLFMSQGYAPLEGRNYTSEGLDLLLALVYYSRMRTIQKLLEMQVMKTNARITSILAGTYEDKIFEDDLWLERNYSLLNARAQFASLTTLSLDHFAAYHDQMGFLHIFPGKVKTGFLTRSVTWALLQVLVGYFLEPLMMFGGITIEECGERMLWMALSEKHAKGVWSLNFDGSESESENLRSYRQNGPLLEHMQAHLQQTLQASEQAI